METLFDRAAKLSRTQVTKMRWALGLHGLASVALGVMILAWPGISVYALTIVFGAYTLATGIVEFSSAFTTEGKEERGWLILMGLLGIGVGVLVLAWPGISALALLYVIGAYAVGLGILCVGASFELPLDGRETTSMVLTGLVSIAFGIVIFAKPGAGALAVLATDRGVRARHRSQRARRRDRRREAARAEGEEDILADRRRRRRRLPSRRIDGRSATTARPTESATSSPAPRIWRPATRP